MIEIDWYGLYGEQWGDDLAPGAVSHPAKFSRALIRHIYRHLLEEGWLAEGDTVLDPFAGVALGALDAMYHGINWFGVELEEKFVELGNANLTLWYEKYGKWYPNLGLALLVQGDSRHLLDVLRDTTDATISSPPYAEARIGQDSREEQIGHNVAYGETEGQLGRMKEGDMVISSPPYADTPISPQGADGATQEWNKAYREYQETGDYQKFQEQMSKKAAEAGYSTSGENLGNLKEGNLDAAVSSPPFGAADKRRTADVQRDHTGWVADCMNRVYNRDNQGEAPGNLAAMEMSVSSPPYGDIEQAGSTKGLLEHGTGLTQGGACFGEYGEAEGQLGRMKYEQKDEDETFWMAARKIVAQVYQVLKPGGHAIWVVKAYVKNKEYIDFPAQWQQLCESVGFRTVHYHRAWVVEDRGAQYDLFGELHEKTVERKSFFRRLAEKKGSPRIDFEVVICMEK